MAKTQQQNLFLFFFSLTFFALNTPFAYTGTGVDASWSQALAMTIQNGKIFGKDFIFNYGPLGYLNTGLIPKNVSIWVAVSFAFFLLANYLLVIKYAFVKAGDNWKKVAFVIYLLFIPWGFFADITFTLFYFFLFHILCVANQRTFSSLIIAVICVFFIFYVKVNLSLVVLVIFFGSLLYFGFKKVLSWQKIVFSITLLSTLIVAFSKILHVDIPSYLGASLKIIDAYQDAMSDIQTTKKDLLALLPFIGLIILLACYSFVGNIKVILKKHQLIFLYVLLGLALFLSIKQQFSTILSLNTFGFFLFMPALFGLLYLFGSEDLKPKTSSLVLWVMLISFGGTQYIRYSFGNFTLNGFIMSYLSPNFFQISSKVPQINDVSDYFKKRNPLVYYNAVKNHHYEENFGEEFRNERQLPSAVLNTIGTNTVDVFPSEIAYIFYNRLNYENRPIIQTYQANSSFLVGKNGEKYRSESAPDFVLYQQQGFRGRYTFWEDSEVLLALLSRYKIVDTFAVNKDSLLLFKKTNPYNIKTISESKINTKLNEEIKISSEKLQYLKLNIEYNIIGKLMRLALQPPYLYCMITYEDGTQERYRATPPILKAGFIANIRVKDLGEAATFFQTKGSNNKRISTLKFESPLAWAFKTDISGQVQVLD